MSTVFHLFIFAPILSLVSPHQLLAAVRNSLAVEVCNSHMFALSDAHEHSFLHVHSTAVP